MQHANTETRWYAPSFIDKWMSWVEQLPVPYWLTYLILFIFESVINHIISWVDGWLPPFTFGPILLLLPVWLWGSFAIMTYLNSISCEALSNFRPILNVSEDQFHRLQYEITTMPSREVFMSSGFWLICYWIFTYVASGTFFETFGYGFFSIYFILLGMFTYSTGSAIYYHSIRQLRWVDRAVKMVKHFDLFSLDPVYAFSVVTARTAMCWIFLLSFTLLTFPMQIAPVPLFALMIAQIVLVTAAFVLPLQIVNRRLVDEKHKLLAEYRQRLASTLARLHHHLGKDELTGMVELNSAVSALNLEGKILENISTWPWRTGTLTGFLSAIGLPIVIFIIQLVITKWVK